MYSRAVLLAIDVGNTQTQIGMFSSAELVESWRLATDRDRPAVRFAEPKALVPVPTDGSFPSGHTASSFACALILAWAAPRLTVPLLLQDGMGP